MLHDMAIGAKKLKISRSVAPGCGEDLFCVPVVNGAPEGSDVTEQF